MFWEREAPQRDTRVAANRVLHENGCGRHIIRDLLLRDRDLQETQDREALASEMEDKRKGQQNPQRTESTFEAATLEETTTLCECLEETVVDTEEVRQKRRRFLEKCQRENEGKRQRTDHGHCGGDDGEGNDSGTVTLHIPEDDNSPRCSNAEQGSIPTSKI
ncbi:uncharacterized protein [Montipora capricornis]|uniref:uncharacterized protein n=1 Tax=Montipora capricornis TaxID=246305 RepID=UPI0035F12AFE